MGNPEMTVERFAELSALRNRRGLEAMPSDIRDRWEAIQTDQNALIADDLGQADGVLARLYATAYREAIRDLEVGGEPPIELPTPTKIELEKPTYLHPRAETPARFSETEPASLDTTGEVDHARAGTAALPFRAGDVSATSSGEAPSTRGGPAGRGETLDIDQAALRGAIFPFQAGVGMHTSGSLTLEQFASLRAELSAAAEPFSSTLARYGLGPASWPSGRRPVARVALRADTCGFQTTEGKGTAP